MTDGLPDPQEVQTRLMRLMAKRGLLFKDVLAVAGPEAERAVLACYEDLRAMLKWMVDPITYIQDEVGWLFAGTPGGGTTWFSRLVTALGHECGHEQVFRAQGCPSTRRVSPENHYNDCSGFITPWAGLLNPGDFFGLVRHPVDMVNTVCGKLEWPVHMAIAYWEGCHDRDYPAGWTHVERPWGFLETIFSTPREHIEFVGAGVDPNARPEKLKREFVTWGDLPLSTRYVALERYGYCKEGLTN